MRAIGKGSLSSILAVGLHITRIALFVFLFILSISMIVPPFMAGLEIAFSGDGWNADLDFDKGSYFDNAYQFIAVLVTLFVVTRLLEVLKTLRFGSPFVKENADRFRAIGYALILGEGAKFLFGFLGLVFGVSDDLSIEIEMIGWLAIVVVFVLSEVFREGARMKEEQDLTV